MSDDEQSEPHPPPPLSLFFLLVLAGASIYVLALLLWPFLLGILMSAAIAVLVYPAHLRLLGLVRSPSVTAVLTLLIVSVLVLVPVLALGAALVDAVRTGVDLLAAHLEGASNAASWALERLQRVAATFGGEIDPEALKRSLIAQLRGGAGLLASRSLDVISGFGGWLLQAGAAIFSLFFFLRDGETLVATLKWLMPVDARQTDRLLGQARDVIFATVYGNVGVAAAQGLLGGLAFLAVGLPSAALWGTVMGVLSLLPVVGATLVWVPAGLWLLVSGEVARGLGLFVFGALVISSIDNFLRALLVGGRTELHPLAVFFSVLGGIALLGAAGVILGPVLFVVATSLIEMARTAIDDQRSRPSLFREHAPPTPIEDPPAD